MRKYTTEHIGELMRQYCADTDLLRLAQTLEALSRAWAELPDPTLRQLELEATLSSDGVLTFHCPSSVLLTYCRRQQSLIERHLSAFLQAHRVERIEFRLH